MSNEQLIAQFKALADPIRLRIVSLCGRAECSVSELTKVMSQSQPRISQHLKQLCEARLLERFRDGHFVYYRVPMGGEQAASRRRLLMLLPEDEPLFEKDFSKLCQLRDIGAAVPSLSSDDATSRRLHRALVELTVAAPLGDLLDIGCGQGRVLKLLASRANRVIGVDIDSDARQLARAELLLAGVENYSLRKGNMYELPFADGEFDTVVLDDVLGDADEPVLALYEAGRQLRPSGRLLILEATDAGDASFIETRFAGWCQAAGLRLSTPRHIPRNDPRWLLAVATPANQETAVA